MASCESMCPVAEINFRSRNHLIDQLEATASTSSGPRSKYVADPTKMVKEYSRSAADTHKYNKPELLRPFPVLQHTIDYLLDLYSPFKGECHVWCCGKCSNYGAKRLSSVTADAPCFHAFSVSFLEIQRVQKVCYIEIKSTL